MEKTSFGLPRRRKPYYLWAAATLCAFASVSGLARLGLLPTCHLDIASSLPYLPLPRPLPEHVTWGEIPSSRNLSWHTCYQGEFECARLDVPMDWQQPTDDKRVILAIIRLPATDRKHYKGPLFFNPGGPGGSGIWAIRDHGHLLQKVAGNNYDILTFDPRGIGASVPRIECFDTIQQQHSWEIQDVGIVDSHPGVLYDAYARMTAYSQHCEAASQTGILEHSSTTYHARDMLAILDSLGPTAQKLHYWGFSYGTVLGGLFAAMYPDRVGRMINDGNVDYGEWFEKTHVNFLRDTDKVLDAFFDLCHRAGPDTCAFYVESPEAIRERFNALLQRLKKHPVIVPTSTDSDGPDLPEIITYSRLQRFVSSVLYQPQHTFPKFASMLAALDQGNGTPLWRLQHKPGYTAVCKAETVPPTEPLAGLDWEATDGASPVVQCSDSVPSDLTIDSMEDLARKLQHMSTATGAVSMLFPFACIGRTIRPRWRFPGPFGANHTAHPILFVANRADNITPLVSARNNSAAFPGSAVLVQNAWGHTSLASPSTCTAGWIRAYLQDGVLPPTETECEPDVLPFGLTAPKSTSTAQHKQAIDTNLAEAVQELSERVAAGPQPTFGLKWVW